MSLALFARSAGAAVVLLSSISAALAQIPISLAAVQERELIATEKIEAALARPVALQYVDTPLKDIVRRVAQESGLTIILTKKIEDAGVQSNQPVTVDFQNVSLESALSRMLANLNLTLMVKDEMLLITTVEDAQSPENMITRVYPVLDLIDRSEWGYDFDPLIDLITSTIEPDSWQDVGGPGSISGHDNSGSLVFSQRRDIHNRIEALLTTLRRVKRLQNISSPLAPASANNPPLSRSLPLPRRSTASRRLPAPNSQFEGGYFSVPAPTVRRSATIEPSSPGASWQLPHVHE